MSLNGKYRVFFATAIILLVYFIIQNCCERASDFTFAESPGEWELDNSYENINIIYENSTQAVSVPIEEKVTDSIDNENDFFFCYPDRAKTILIYNDEIKNQTLLKVSADKGMTWNNYVLADSNTGTVTYASVGFCNADFGWCLVGNDGNLYLWSFSLFLTNDGGETWSKANIPDIREKTVVNAIFFATPQTGYLCTTRRRSDALSPIYKTEDGGQTWEEWNPPLLQASCIQYEATGGSFHGMYGVMYLKKYSYSADYGSYDISHYTLISKDYGKNWESYS